MNWSVADREDRPPPGIGADHLAIGCGGIRRRQPEAAAEERHLAPDVDAVAGTEDLVGLALGALVLRQLRHRWRQEGVDQQRAADGHRRTGEAAGNCRRGRSPHRRQRAVGQRRGDDGDDRDADHRRDAPAATAGRQQPDRQIRPRLRPHAMPVRPLDRLLAEERHAVRPQHRVRLDQLDDLGDRQPRRHRIINPPLLERVGTTGDRNQGTGDSGRVGQAAGRIAKDRTGPVNHVPVSCFLAPGS